MTVKLSSLRVTSTHDPSGFIAGNRALQASVDGTGKSVAAMSHTIEMMNGKVSQSGDIVARLSRQYLPGYRGAEEFARGLWKVNAALEAGKTSHTEAVNLLSGMHQRLGRAADAAELAGQGYHDLARAVDAANRSIASQSRASVESAGGLARAADATKLNAAQMANLSYQINDIGVMLASGQNPFVMLMQQGSQIVQIFDPRVGVGGALKATGAAMLQYLTNPLMLTVVGLASVAGAASYLWRTVSVDSKGAEQSVERHVALVKELERGYGLAADKVKAMSFETSAMMRFETAQSANELRLLHRSGQQDLFSPSVQGRGGFGLMPEYDARTDQTRWSVTGEFAPFAEPILMARRAAEAGIPVMREFRQAVAEIWARNPNDPAIAATAKHLLEETKEVKEAEDSYRGATRAKEHFFKAFDAAGRLRYGDWAREDMAKLRAYEVEQQVEMRRARDRFEADMFGMSALSPSERAMAARAREAAVRNDGESSPLRGQRIELAETRALLEAEHALRQSQQDRIRSYETSLSSQRLELELIGRTTGEAERMRFEFQQMQQVRDEAYRNGIRTQEEFQRYFGREVELIREAAAEYARYAELIARTNLINDLRFEREQLFRGRDEQAIASRLRGTGIDLDDPIADYMRQTRMMEEGKQFGVELLTGIRNSLMSGGEDLGKVILTSISNAFLKASDKFIEQLVNQLAQSAFGGPATAPNGGFAPNTTGGVFFGAIANDNYASGAVTRQPLGSIEAYRQAISSIESGSFAGNYSAIGPTHPTLGRALGRYQIMEANVAPWSRAALGRELTAGQFLANPSYQDAVFDHRFGGYVERFGERGAAQAWLGGPGSVGKVGRSDVLGTTVGDYGDRFMAALDKLGGRAEAASGPIAAMADGAAGASRGLGGLSSALTQFPSAPVSGGAGPFGFLGSLFGGLPSVDFMNGLSPLATSSILGGSIGLYHEGGIAGQATRMRYGVNPNIFIGAPRYHDGGLAGDEVPAILRRGEPVFKSMDHARQVVGGSEKRQSKVELHVNLTGGTGNAEIRQMIYEGSRIALAEYEESMNSGTRVDRDDERMRLSY